MHVRTSIVHPPRVTVVTYTDATHYTVRNADAQAVWDTMKARLGASRVRGQVAARPDIKAAEQRPMSESYVAEYVAGLRRRRTAIAHVVPDVQTGVRDEWIGA